MLKVLVDGGIVTIRSTILILAECATVTTSSKEIPKEAEVRNENFKVTLHPNFLDQEVAIGGTLFAKGQAELCSLLKKNLDIFAWQPSDMTGVPQSVAEHRLNIREGYSPVRQKKKGQASECAKAIQAEMAESDKEKTTFHTSQGVYYYTKMPFGLKNARVTYQRLVDKAFDSQVGRNIEVPEGIKPCPNKTKAVLQLPSPRKIKEVQSLNGKLASLNSFLSKSAEKSLPLFKTLNKCIKKSNFHWTPEAEQAFKQLKQHFSKLPLLVAPKPKEELIVYMSASHGAISTVLMTKRGTIQTPILVDILVENPDEAPPDTLVVETPQEPWTLFIDGSSCVDGSGAGLILTNTEGTKFTYALRFQFTTSNNEAEYEALIAGLRIAAQIGEEEVATVVEEEGPTWMTPIMEFLKDGIIPGDRKEASKLHIKARQYKLLEGVLYRRSFLKSWLRCVGPLQADYVIQEIHNGSCRINIAGPFLEGPGKVKFLIVAMDYFTKWIEAKAVATITGNQVKKFVWDNIVCRFGLPGEIISDNSKQFSDNLFRDWCEKLNITQCFALVKYPQSNGLVKRANRSFGEGIKSCLGEGNKNWI
ncbi:reverse transcriptase domain-containing protein [Tanacetum coccineum]|uniref:Reverse transcriptase domain-containing protein n=1 Tax=Tanacetum coccineum TaxID=301880 RepID=A0ABQ4WTN8_9ASTR